MKKIQNRKINIYILEPKWYPSKALKILKSFAIVDKAKVNQRKIGNISRYDCLIVRLKHYISKELMEKSRKLKLIASPTTGLNHIDLNAARQLGVEVLSLRNEKRFLSKISATAEYTIALMMALLRRIPAACYSVNRRHWDRDLFKGTELKGKTLGIIGYGRLGGMVANYARSFGMKIICYDTCHKALKRHVKQVPLNTLLRRSDVITVHIPYEDKTRNFVDAKIFNKMKKGTYLLIPQGVK